MKKLIYSSLIMTFLFILVAGGAWAGKGGKPGKPPGGNGEESDYKVTDLGTLDGEKKSSSAARDISVNGQVVGWSDDGQQTLATLWTVSVDGYMLDVQSLGTLEGQTSSEAYAINQDGTIVAGHAGTIEYPVPVCWNLSDSLITELDPLNGFSYGVAYDVNNNGQIAGISIDFGGEILVYAATLWDAGQTPTPLPFLDGSRGYSNARGINNDGDVVGMSFVRVDVGGEEHYLTHAVLWRYNGNGYDEVYDLHRWEYAKSHHSSAGAITNRIPSENGEIVEITGGRSLFPDGTPVATVWTVALEPCEVIDIRDLGLPASALDINDAGEMVGQDRSTNFARPVVWSAENEIVVLPLPKKGSGSAEGINGDGQIVGWSKSGRNSRAVLWTKKN